MNDEETRARGKEAQSVRSRRRWMIAGLAGVAVAAAAAGTVALASDGGRTLLPDGRDMVAVPGASYAVGVAARDRDHVAPASVLLEPFYIDRTEVTNAAYSRFVKATGRPAPTGWQRGAAPSGQARHPVEGVTYDDAEAYCEWAGKRLPTEAEWEVAARGPSATLYPWGNDPEGVPIPARDTYPVGSIRRNRSALGAYDMAGNAWEWVAEPYADVPDGARVLRGGGSGLVRDMAFRLVGSPTAETIVMAAGLRCASSEVATGYSDDFSDPESGWPVDESGGLSTGYHPPGVFHLVAERANLRRTVTGGITVGDGVVETAAEVETTASGAGPFRFGLVTRAGRDGYYAFVVQPHTKEWFVLEGSGRSVRRLATGASGIVAGLDGENALRVEMNGATLDFLVNGWLVARVQDSTHSAGEVGFYVETSADPKAHVHFDRIEVERPARTGG